MSLHDIFQGMVTRFLKEKRNRFFITLYETKVWEMVFIWLNKFGNTFIWY